MRRTKNLFQVTSPEKPFSLQRYRYIQRETLGLMEGDEQVGATHVTGEKMEEGDIVWTLKDKVGKLYVLGTDQVKPE